ncbi:MAG TPA: CRISPR-associated protein Csx3 [Roseiflexaceae bacterium]|nr:CRISPR-associated protein Csx3 [Roseiflexaceae bacterium]
MASMFPAVLIGGPPKSGKSQLSLRLHQALLRRGVSHYLLRANPDGEGNWFYGSQPALAAELRANAKVLWPNTVAGYADKLARDIERRHLPLLVDLGGVVSDENHKLAAQCSHAIVIAADPGDLPAWRGLAESHGLVQLAELRSDLRGAQTITDNGATLRGVISGLDPDLTPEGVCFEALVERVAAVFNYAPEELERAHMAQTAVDLPLNLERAIPPLPAHLEAVQPWDPSELPVLLENLPEGESLGLYGRAPAWLYSALAAFAFPQAVELFDPRLGWVTPPQLAEGDQPDPRLTWEATNDVDMVQLTFKLPGRYLERSEADGLPVPPVAGRGVILDGPLPNWLAAALARHYRRSAAWIAHYRPQLHGCVVIWSPSGAPAVGTLIRSLL